MKTVTTGVVLVLVVSLGGCGKEGDFEQTVTPPQVSLHVAAIQGDVAAIEQHIEAGSDVDQKDAYGSTALIAAATFGKTAAAKALIEAGADLTIANNEGSTALHVAAFLCRAEIVEALLAKGADKDARNKAGSTALESVAAPFEAVKVVYDAIGEGLRPLGLRLDYERIRATRPRIAEMLR